MQQKTRGGRYWRAGRSWCAGCAGRRRRRCQRALRCRHRALHKFSRFVGGMERLSSAAQPQPAAGRLLARAPWGSRRGRRRQAGRSRRIKRRRHLTTDLLVWAWHRPDETRRSTSSDAGLGRVASDIGAVFWCGRWLLGRRDSAQTSFYFSWTLDIRRPGRADALPEAPAGSFVRAGVPGLRQQKKELRSGTRQSSQRDACWWARTKGNSTQGRGRATGGLAGSNPGSDDFAPFVGPSLFRKSQGSGQRASGEI